MKVILTDKVKTLGNIGEIVNVSAGYARNYLIPNQFAVTANDGNSRQLQHQQKLLAKKMEAEVTAATEVKKKIDGLTLELVKKVGGTGRLFGTVTTSELTKELEAQGISVERRLMSVSSPIKSLGSYDISVKLFSNIDATFKLNVVMDPKQAEEAKAKQALLEKKLLEQKEAKDDDTAEEVEAAVETVELTEEQKLKEEADKILKSF